MFTACRNDLSLALDGLHVRSGFGNWPPASGPVVEQAFPARRNASGSRNLERDERKPLQYKYPWYLPR